MKKFRLLFIPLFAALLAQSCISEPENHHLSVLYPNANVYYADHTEDSVVFLTFDNWKVRSLQSWLKLTTNDSYNFTFDNKMLYRFAVKTVLEPNTTGRTRLGEVMVNSYEYTAYALYPQVGYLNITNPTCKIESVHELGIPDSVSFILADSAYVELDSICFNVKDKWKLDFAEGANREWLTLNAVQGAAGMNTVLLTMQPNEATEPRETKLVLTCKTVENEIVVRQEARKKEEN